MPRESHIPAIDEGDKHQCWALYMGGFEPHEIATETGVNANTLRSWMLRDEWTKQREQIIAARRKKNPPEKSALAKMLAPDKAVDNVKKFRAATNAMAAEDAEHWKDMDPQERLVVAPAIASLNNVHRKNLELDKEEERGGKSLINITFLNNPDAVKLLPTIDVDMEALPPRSEE